MKLKQKTQNVNWNGKDYPVPFHLDLEIDNGNVIEIKNRFGGGKCNLPWFAVAVYDMILGAEMMRSWEAHQQGLEWFLKYFPDEYMVLLD